MKRFFTKTFNLSFAGGSLEVRDAADLEAALRDRIAPSSIQIAMLGSMEAEDRRREAARISDLEYRIRPALSPFADSAAAPVTVLEAIDLEALPDDNDWRGILLAVRSLKPPQEELSRAALTQFSEYLARLRELLQAIDANRPLMETGPGRVLAEPDELDEDSPRQRLAFDLGQLAGQGAPGPTAPESGGGHALPDVPQFGRMPKGEAIAVALADHQSLDILLARHCFTVVAGSPALLIDENGLDYPLRKGKNILGRSSQCEVTVDACFRGVSRRHLLIEIGAGNDVRLTDLSSLGTFLASEHLRPLLH